MGMSNVNSVFSLLVMLKEVTKTMCATMILGSSLHI